MVGLDQVKDRESAKNIEQITHCFVEQLSPLKVFLFGSFAEGTYTDDSDYDFYIVVNDELDTWEARNPAHKGQFVMFRIVPWILLWGRIRGLKSMVLRGTPFLSRARFSERANFCTINQVP